MTTETEKPQVTANEVAEAIGHAIAQAVDPEERKRALHARANDWLRSRAGKRVQIAPDGSEQPLTAGRGLDQGARGAAASGGQTTNELANAWLRGEGRDD